MKLLTNLSLMVLIFFLLSQEAKSIDLKKYDNVDIISSSIKFDNIKDSTKLSAVFFLAGKHYGSNKIGSAEKFLNTFDKAASTLNHYDVTTAIVDCSMDEIQNIQYCSQSTDTVYTFQTGEMLLDLEIDVMFSEDAIIANILQILLLDETPLLADISERKDLEKKMCGEKDIILTYVAAVGLKEHRTLLETVFAYDDVYQFAITTDLEAAEGLQSYESLKGDSSSLLMWVIFSSEKDCRDSVPNTLYKGASTLKSFSGFISSLKEPIMSSIEDLFPQDRKKAFEMDRPLPTLFVYKNTDFSNKIEFEMALDSVATASTRGSLFFLIVNLNDNESKKEAESNGFDGTLPALSLRMQGSKEHVFEYPKTDMKSSILTFLNSHGLLLNKTAKEERNEIDEFLKGEFDDEIYALQSRVESQDDEIAKEVHNLKLKNIEIQIPELYRRGFKEKISSKDTALVLFYLAFDPIGVAARTFLNEASTLLLKQEKEKVLLASVNCFDATDVCTAEKITAYPTLNIYKKGKLERIYSGRIDTESLLRTAKLSINEYPIELQTEEDVTKFMSGNFPENIKDVSKSTVLILASREDKEFIQAYKEVCNDLSYAAPLGIVYDGLAAKLKDVFNVNVPSVIARNYDDPVDQLRRLSTNLDKKSIQYFIKQSSLSLLPELREDTFPAIYMYNIPISILFIDESNPESAVSKDIFSDIAVSKQVTNTSFCWASINSVSHITDMIKANIKNQDLPFVAVIDYQISGIHIKSVGTLTSDNIKHWIIDVLKRQKEPSLKLTTKEWGPNREHYNFLDFIDQLDEHPLRIPKEDTKNIESAHAVKDKALDNIDNNEEANLRSQLLISKNARLSDYHGSKTNIHSEL